MIAPRWTGIGAFRAFPAAQAMTLPRPYGLRKYVLYAKGEQPDES